MPFALRLRAEGRAGLVIYLTAGDPDPDTSLALFQGLAGAGADLIEIGMPFSDPMADGPAIQAAGQRALKRGMNLRKTLAMVRDEVTLDGSRAAVIGVGPVGLRTAELLRREGAEVTVLTFPPDVFEGKFRRASGVEAAQDAGFNVIEPDSSDELDAALRDHVAVFVAGPAGIQVLRRSGWKQIEGLQVVVDYSAADPVGVEGVARDDALEDEDGIKKLGALAVGGPKMKLQKRCVQRMFETKGTVMDLDGVYDVAVELL